MSAHGKSAPRALVLVGFMGAGKTSVGRELAARLAWRFVDLDDLIVAAAGKTIPEIFRDGGESEFRSFEHAALKQILGELAESQPTVIALGGGAFAQDNNVLLLRSHAFPVVFLDAVVSDLIQRCQGAATERPLFADENHFRQLYEARRSYYMKADIRVETSGRSIAQVASEVLTRLRLADRNEDS